MFVFKKLKQIKISYLSENLSRREHLGDIGVDERITLKWILVVM
jgi:hypothetical protein